MQTDWIYPRRARKSGRRPLTAPDAINKSTTTRAARTSALPCPPVHNDSTRYEYTEHNFIQHTNRKQLSRIVSGIYTSVTTRENDDI